MKTVERYYVDKGGTPKYAIVIRDRISPLGKQTYPTDIAITITSGMFNSRKEQEDLADRICSLLNE